MSRIASWSAGTSDDWIGWFTGAGDDALDAVRGRELDEPVRQAWSDAVLELEGSMVAQSLLGGGIWVPDPSDGPYGAMTVGLVVPDASRPLTPSKLLKAVRKPRRERGTRVIDYSAGTDLDALDVGPMVVQSEIRADRSTGVLRSQIAVTVFPPGTTDLLRLEFVTDRQPEFPALGDESIVVIQNLTVTLEP